MMLCWNMQLEHVGRPWKTCGTQALAKPLAMDPALTLESAVTKATKAIW